jgi:type II secretory pathway pseudopilin PulG
MRVRDRLVIAVIAALAVVGAMWVVLVSPERAKVTSLSAQISTQRAALDTAEAQALAARHAAAGYVDHLAQIGEVMKAIPQTPAEAEIVATIDRLSGARVQPDFRELDVGTDASTAQGPQALSLTFTYWTTYRGLQNFLGALDNLTSTDGTNVKADGRLFTVTAVSLVPLDTGAAPADVAKATVTADVYLQTTTAPATGATASTGPVS